MCIFQDEDIYGINFLFIDTTKYVHINLWNGNFDVGIMKFFILHLVRPQSVS